MIGQKRVVIEKFTNIFCGSCPNASIEIEKLVEAYPGTIWMKHFKPVDFEEVPLENEQSLQLWNDLGVFGVPGAMVDRTTVGASPVSYNIARWKTLLEERLAEPEYAQIDIADVSYDVDNRLLEFKIRVEFNELPPEGALRISAVMLEDSVKKKQKSYYNDVAGHPLEGLGEYIWDYIHPNVVRGILNEAWGTAGVIPESPSVGVPYEESFSYIIEDTHKVKNMKIVAMVSQHEAAITSRQVLNATEVKLIDSGLVLSSTDDNALSAYSGLTLSPNPVVSRLDVSFETIPEELYMTDIQGRSVLHFGRLEKQLSLDLSELAQGTYYLTGRVGEHFFNEKVIKK